MIHATYGSTATFYTTTEEKRIDTAVPKAQIRYLFKFTNNLSGGVVYGYGQSQAVNDRYTSVQILGSNTNRFNGSNQAIWDYSTTSAWRCYYSGGYDDYRSIDADWYIKGFKSSPTTEYLAASSSAFASNGANNTVTLPVGGSPSTFVDGDEISLVLKNLTINY